MNLDAKIGSKIFCKDLQAKVLSEKKLFIKIQKQKPYKKANSHDTLDIDSLENQFPTPLEPDLCGLSFPHLFLGLYLEITFLICFLHPDLSRP